MRSQVFFYSGVDAGSYSKSNAADDSYGTGKLIPYGERGMKHALASAILAIVLPFTLACGSGQHFMETTTPPPPPSQVPLTKLSTDTFTNISSQHATEVEPDTFAFGSTIVSAFQVGRIFSGGSADVGFATSTDGGAAWTSGLLPGITIFQGGSFSAASDAAVAYDAAHGIWIICTLPLGTFNEAAVSRSSDGINWSGPVRVSTTPDADKTWIVCDNTSGSPFFGHCYVQWDDPSRGGLIWMRTSTDGGLTWGVERNTADFARGIGGQPLVQPDGTVVVPITNISGNSMLAFSSKDGGASWSKTSVIANIADHLVAGGLRTSALPSAEIDAVGKIYVVWQDCRFRSGCISNDLVLSTSIDGRTWTAPIRIPIDSATSTADHFIPGLAVDPSTSGDTAHLALTYYFYPTANCSASSCALEVGFISSPDAGNSWTVAQTIAGPMSLSWLPNTFAGLMVGDYISTSYSGGSARGVFAVAHSNSGSKFDEAIYTTTSALGEKNAAMSRSLREQPVPDARSDHPVRAFYDLEHRYPAEPPK